MKYIFLSNQRKNTNIAHFLLVPGVCNLSFSIRWSWSKHSFDPFCAEDELLVGHVGPSFCLDSSRSQGYSCANKTQTVADGWVKLHSAAHFLFHVGTNLVPDLRHHLLISRCILSWTNSCPTQNRFQVFSEKTLRHCQHVVFKVILGSLESFLNAKTPANAGPQHQDPGIIILGNMLPHPSLHIYHLFPTDK